VKALIRSLSQPGGLDRPQGPGKQAEGLLDGPAAEHGRLSPNVLLGLRWLALGVEFVAVLGALFWIGPEPRLTACVGVVLAAGLVNTVLTLRLMRPNPAPEWSLALQLGFDVVQLSIVLFLTGGVLNPFNLLLIAPVTLAGASLKGRYALALGVLAAIALLAMSFWAPPPPWGFGGQVALPLFFRLACVFAVLSGLALTAGYAWRAATEAARIELALNVTQRVLAREQRLSALGGLAAAAAHELGTPLATISVVAKEMVREAPEGPLREDADLLVSQAERCREILRRLTEEPETDDAVHARMTLLQFLDEVVEPHVNTEVRVEAVVSGPPGQRPPEIRRMPEVLHAVTTFVENAVDFARSEVLVSMRFDETSVQIEVRDDGQGFSADILHRLGQPYVTSRPGAEGSRSGHIGMGLGFFIAKTLLERGGAKVDFHNAKGGGALVGARWPRAAIEAPPAPGGFELGALEPLDAFATQPKGA
jgi:two-component system, sensor histidine kinase RegB